MEARYLCKGHFYELCQNLNKADQFWNKAMSMGLQAVNTENHEQAQDCFGAAYEAANIILDRQVSHNASAETASNAMLSAQYLSTTLVKLGKTKQAKTVLNQLQEKFAFLCRNPLVNEKLRQLLCGCLIPYIEKLYGVALETYEASDTFEMKYNGFWVNSSASYH